MSYKSSQKVFIALVILIAVFFMNPWAVDAQITNLTRYDTPSFWYYKYSVVPKILDSHQDIYQNPQGTIDPQWLECREHMEIRTLGSLVLSICPIKGTYRVDPVFGIFDPGHIWQVARYYLEK